MKKIVVFLFLLLSLSSFAYGENITVGNHSFSIELIIEPQCGELQENIFQIKRYNYTSGMEAERITYNTSCGERHTSIEKQINSHSSSKTGSCMFVRSDNYTITLAHETSNFSWNISVLCDDYVPADNSSIEEELEVQPLCFSQFFLDVNNDVFEEGEQLTMDFSLDTVPDYLEIAYWIETLNGTYLKTKRTTTNLDTKKHTFKSTHQLERGAFVYAVAKDNCSEQLQKKLVLIKGVVENELASEPSLFIQHIEQASEQHIKATIRAHRGQSKSTVVHIYVNNDQGKTISREKITLEHKNTGGVFQTILPVGNEEKGTVVVEGLHLKDTKEFLLEQQQNIELIHTHTKQKYYTNNITWYVRTKQKSPLIIKVTTDNEQKNIFVSQTGEETQHVTLSYSGGAIHTSITDGKETLERTDYPQLIQNIIQEAPLQNKQESQTVNVTFNHQENTSLSPLKKNFKKEQTTTNTLQQKALYGLFGTVIAGSAYLLLKEQ